MRLLLTAYKTHVIPYYRSFFSKGYITVLIFLLSAIIYVNYFKGFPVISSWPGNLIFDYCLYLFSFAGAYFLQIFFYRNNAILFQKEFLLLLFITPALFALRVNSKFFAAEIYSPFIVSCFNYISRAVLLILLTAILWYWKQKRNMLSNVFSKTSNSHIYWMMLLLMIPLLWLAAGKASFAAVYPRYIIQAGLTSEDNILKYLLFEICYGFDFFSIEYFFRGFLIFAFTKHVGIRAILPAACFYCCIHLGKPMPEAISSFFGGLLLGIISYNTKSIRGGLMLHLGIAWMMELFAWILYHS